MKHLGRPSKIEKTCVVHIPKTEMLLSVIRVNSWLILLSNRRDLLFFGNQRLGKQVTEDLNKIRHELGGPASITDLDDLEP